MENTKRLDLIEMEVRAEYWENSSRIPGKPE